MTEKILVVDDEPDVLMIVQTGLEAEGYDVVTATNGPDALETAQKELPKLILLDVMMPGMDGFEVLSNLKENEATCEIPVIMLTGLSDKTKIQQALVSGIDYYVVKPFDFEDLTSKVRTALDEAAFN